MNYTVFKPNTKNSGGILKFRVSTVKNEKKDIWEERLFVELVPQNGWNEKTKTGSFDASSKKFVMLNTNEAGEILHAIETKIPFETYHKSGDSGTFIKFAPFVSKRKFGKEGMTGHRVDDVFNFAFGIVGDLKLSVSLAPGEVFALKVFLEKFIVSSCSLAGKEEDRKFKQGQKKENKKQKEETVSTEGDEVEDDEDDDVPF